MGPGDRTGDNCEGPIAPAVPFEPVGMDKHGIGDAAPFAHKPRAGRQRNRRCGLLRVACLRVEVQAFQLANDRFGEAAERPLLEFVGDCAHAAVLRFRDFAMEGVDIFRLRWLAALDLTLARPKAPQIAGRALGGSGSASP
jgi:hypothetical protein